MANKSLRMDRVDKIRELYSKGLPKKRIARILGLSKNTVKKYLKKAGAVEEYSQMNAEKKRRELHGARTDTNRDEVLRELLPHINRELENLFITGATGCGKSFLACAVGNQACLMGYRTMYFNMNRLCEQIAVAQVDGTFIKWMNRIQKARLIVIDDFGLQPLTQQVKLALLQILEDRYARASTIICSQLPVAKWYEYIDDATIADAIMDRLTAKASRIELKGKSLRRRS